MKSLRIAAVTGLVMAVLAAATSPSFAADLKLSDAAFVLEDVESERRYRERYYGTLSEP